MKVFCSNIGNCRIAWTQAIFHLIGNSIPSNPERGICITRLCANFFITADPWNSTIFICILSHYISNFFMYTIIICFVCTSFVRWRYKPSTFNVFIFQFKIYGKVSAVPSLQIKLKDPGSSRHLGKPPFSHPNSFTTFTSLLPLHLH